MIHGSGIYAEKRYPEKRHVPYRFIYGSAPRLTTPLQAPFAAPPPPHKILIVHMVKDRVAYRAPYYQRGAKRISLRVPSMSQNIHQIKLEGVRT